MRHEPSVSCTKSRSSLDLFSAVLASSITVHRQILFQTYLGASGMHVCKRGVCLSTFTSPWRHRSGRFSPIDRWSLISSFPYFFFFSRLLIVFCPPLAPFPIAIKCYRLEQGNATCRGEMYVPCCGFWR